MNTYENLSKNEIIDDLLDSENSSSYTVCEFDKNKNIFIVGKDGKYGIVNSFGKVILPTFFSREKIETIKDIVNEPVNPALNQGENTSISSFKEVVIANLDFPFDECSDFTDGVAVVGKNKKYGIVDSDFNVIVSLKYDEVVIVDNDLFCIRTGNLWGFADSKGNTILPPTLSSYGEFYGTYFKDAVTTDGKKIYVYIDRSKEFTSIHTFDKIFYMNEGVAPFYDNGKWGYIKKNGEIIACSKEFEELGVFTEGMGLIKKNGLYGFIDIYGNEKIPYIYEEVDIFINGFAKVQLNGKWGIIDSLGQLRADYEYDEISDFTNNFAVVRKGIKNNVLDTSFNKKFEDTPIFIREYTSEIGEDYMIFKENHKYGYLYLGNEENRKAEIPASFDYALPFKKGFAKVRIDNNYAIINTDGEYVLPPIFSTLSSFDYFGIAEYSVYYNIQDMTKTGFLVRNNDIIMVMAYDSLKLLDRQTFLVSNDNKFGIVNISNDVIIPLAYSSIQPIGENLYIIESEGLYQLADISDPKAPRYSRKYDEIIGLHDDYSAVKLDNKYAYCNRNFDEITEFLFDEVDSFRGEYAVIKIDNKYGYLNKNAQIKLLDYDSIAPFNDGYAFVTKNGKKTIIDTSFNEISNQKYDDIIKVDENRLLLLDDALKKTFLLTFRYKDIYSEYKIDDGIYYKDNIVYANDNEIFTVNSKMKIQNFQYQKSMNDTIVNAIKAQTKNKKENNRKTKKRGTSKKFDF